MVAVYPVTLWFSSLPARIVISRIPLYSPWSQLPWNHISNKKENIILFNNTIFIINNPRCKHSSPTQTSSDGNQTTSTLSIVLSHADANKYLSCRAYNHAVPAKVLEDRWRLDIQCEYCNYELLCICVRGRWPVISRKEKLRHRENILIFIFIIISRPYFIFCPHLSPNFNALSKFLSPSSWWLTTSRLLPSNVP